IARIERVIAEIFEQPSVESITAALGDDTDLPAAPRAKLRRIVIGVYAKLLHILHAGLQPEYAAHFTADVARVVGDDAAGFNAIVAERVFFEGAGVEANVVKGSTCEIDRAGRQQVKLRNLAPVDRQFLNLPRGDVAANRCGSGV